jgi:type II secretory pathway pseudopilin PulG
MRDPTATIFRESFESKAKRTISMTRQPRSFPTAARRSRSGFTMVEIVIAFLIIAILTAVMVPTMTKRSDDAKIVATQDDLRRLADAEERCSVDIGYVVRLYALNDGSRSDGIANTDPANQLSGLLDNSVSLNNIYSSNNPTYLFISTSTQGFLPSATQDNLFHNLTTGMTSSGSSYGSVASWHGPYLNWTRDANKNDWPDDVWGNDYLFFSVNGVIAPPSGSDTTDFSYPFKPTYKFPTGTGKDYPAEKIFDRFTILSLGPNGMPGDGSGDTTTPASPGNFGKGDDIYISFGS